MKNYLSPNAELADSSLMPHKMLIFKPINLKDFKEVAFLHCRVRVRWSPSGAEQGQLQAELCTTETKAAWPT